jgi:hypothetical protein
MYIYIYIYIYICMCVITVSRFSNFELFVCLIRCHLKASFVSEVVGIAVKGIRVKA